MTEPLKVFLGFDRREPDAYRVAEHSLRKRASIRLDVQALALEPLQQAGLYTRPTERRDGRLWDGLSQLPLSTEFSITRFLVPHLAGYRGWALFADCDFLFRADVAELLEGVKERAALYCVNLPYDTKLDACRDEIVETGDKMDGQAQKAYAMKGWSSLLLWNCAHLLHAGQLERVKRWPYLWLHQLRWAGHWPEVDYLPRAWNWREGIDPDSIAPKAVHFTRGIPSMPGYENSAYADEWRAVLGEATCALAS